MHRTSSPSTPGNVSGFRNLSVATPSLARILLGMLLIFLAGSLPAEEEVPGDPGEPGENATVIIGEGHVWRFFRGTQDPPADWNQPAFEDSAWEQGTTGIGYGDEDDRTVLEDMRCALREGAGEGEDRCAGGGYLAFFARTSFESPVIPEGEGLFLRVSYDDGLVLYLNGVQVGRVNMPDGPVSRETAALRAIGDAPREPDATILIPAELLRTGSNSLAASIHNVNLWSSDASFIPRLVVGSIVEPEPTCKDRCSARAAEAAAACLAEGLPESECAARKAAVFEECVHAECETDPPRPDCRERCSARAAEAAAACAAEGLPETECAARKEAIFEECLRDECNVDPPEPGCKDRCEQGAAKVFDQCRAEGGSEDQCHDRSAAALRECVANCEEKPPEKPCADECAGSGNAVFLACLEAGGDREDCRRRADGIVALCLERCGAGTPCEDRCAVAAQIVLTGCDLAELPEGDCRAMANTVLERCVGGCEPAPSCEEGCEELASRAVAECTAREGPAEECAAAGAAVLDECKAHCEGEPVPGCDVQCEGKAAEMLEHCLGEGIPEGECKADRDAFLARCREELGEICDQERAALETAFKLFTRGDANRDDKMDLADAVDVLGYLFLGTAAPGCEDAADANDDGQLNITDPILILSSLFLGSGPLPAPSGEKGQDPTSDGLLCES